MAISDDDIEDLAKSPRKTETEEGTVVERNVEELIKAEQYLAGKDIGNNPLHGLRISRCKPGGPV